MPALSQTPQQTTTPVQTQTPQTGGGGRSPQSNSQANEQLDAGSSWDDVLSGKTELKKGDKGEAVKTLQQKLSGAGFAVATTGELGPTTQEKVVAFQKAHQIQQTGTVGKSTAAALDKAPTVGGAKPTFTASVYNDHMKKLPQMDLKPSSIQKGEVDAFLENWKQNAAKYKAVAAKVNLPAELIAAIHWREGSGDFSTYLHNGDPLGKKTVHVPKGILFYKWEDAAVHALTMDQFRSLAKDVNLSSGSKDMAAMATFSEFYNGTGYHNKGISSPYVYAGTDQYSKGKYIADGRFSWDHVDQQPGTMLLIQS
ncbi:MAG TPA: peptidoglycan-binding protein, partial [Myxococcota bacterium]|nr:peptidoglycan-binding protein [Myxococcota bacterium]